jgi:hypothetical protein
MCIAKFPPLVRAKIHACLGMISEIADKNKALIPNVEIPDAARGKILTRF